MSTAPHLWRHQSARRDPVYGGNHVRPQCAWVIPDERVGLRNGVEEDRRHLQFRCRSDQGLEIPERRCRPIGEDRPEHDECEDAHRRPVETQEAEDRPGPDGNEETPEDASLIVTRFENEFEVQVP